jgi:cyclophilin family peptidyl-prolyl cis-trans isomerase
VRTAARRPTARWGALLLNGLAALAVAAAGGCSRAASPGSQAAAVEGGPDAATDLLDAIARAEVARRAARMPPDVQSHHDPAIRRAAARAFARILDPDDAPLLRALEDADPLTAAWGAYGLGESCKGHEENHVKALVARLASLDPADAGAAGTIEPLPVLLRAVGRCGGDRAEPTLRAWLPSGGSTAEAAAYALGDVAARAGSLSLESSGALLAAVQASPPVAAALYPFSRGEGTAPEEIAPRLLAAARSALARAGAERIFAVRVLGRAADARAPEDLARVLSSDGYTTAERAEAAHALARIHGAGQIALADALAALVAEGGAAAALSGDSFPVVLAALGAAGDEAAARVAAPLWTLARLKVEAGAPAARVRRASALRCAAAERLARGAWDSDVLSGCDLGDGESGERARLAALDRVPFDRPRRAAWGELARSRHVRIREAALGAIARHPELGDAARAAIAQALAATEPGVVAAAATVVQTHPESVLVLADSERRAALDPASPPPPSNPARQLDKAVATALRAALARDWSEDLVETRVALLDAAVAGGLLTGAPSGSDASAPSGSNEARKAAEAACKDPNATVRARAAKALLAAGASGASGANGTAPPSCPAPDPAPDPPPELAHPLARPSRVVFETDAGALAVRFDPAFAPLAATRFVALARAGFYTGVTIHRVVAGFVAQLGDRGGDGYGGSGDLLPCETTPVPFQAFDVGVALAGRDTGSSQIFVTLARTPHLDGEYAWVGRAEGDWSAAAEGDVIQAVHVEE